MDLVGGEGGGEGTFRLIQVSYHQNLSTPLIMMIRF